MHDIVERVERGWRELICNKQPAREPTRQAASMGVAYAQYLGAMPPEMLHEYLDAVRKRYLLQ